MAMSPDSNCLFLVVVEILVRFLCIGERVGFAAFDNVEKFVELEGKGDLVRPEVVAKRVECRETDGLVVVLVFFAVGAGHCVRYDRLTDCRLSCLFMSTLDVFSPYMCESSF